MKNAASLKIPSNLMHILADEGYWEDESFDPILISIEEIHHKGKDKICYEASFALPDTPEDMDGYLWEDTVSAFLAATQPLVAPKIIGESEDETCIMWADDEDNFRILLDAMIQLLRDPALAEQYIPDGSDAEEQ